MKLGMRENLEENNALSKAFLPLLRQSRPCETSALGFYAGDANLYRFVGDDPTNALDPSGLQEEKQIEAVKGTDAKLEKNTFKLKDSKGTVKVFIDVTIKNPRGSQEDGEIQIQFTADKDIPSDTHWLQFARRQDLDKDGIDVSTPVRMGRGGKQIWQKPGEKGRFVDCAGLPDSKVPIYYDALRKSTRRGKRELSIFDKPSFNRRLMDVKQVWSFDTFLVSEGKVYYHLQWKQVATFKDGKWVVKYTEIKGEPVTRLPEWARKD